MGRLFTKILVNDPRQDYSYRFLQTWQRSLLIEFHLTTMSWKQRLAGTTMEQNCASLFRSACLFPLVSTHNTSKSRLENYTEHERATARTYG